MTHKQHIQLALGFSDQEYSELVEQGGYLWINRYFHKDPDTIKILSTCAQFWRWWTNQWEIRDQVYIFQTGIDVIGERLEGQYWQIAYDEYFEIHNPMKLIIIPNNEVIKAKRKLIHEQDLQLQKLQA